MADGEQDPVIKQRVIRLAVDFSAKALQNKPSYALKVLEHILMTQAIDSPEYPLYSEAVRELYSLSTYEVRRLAIRYSDYFSVCSSQSQVTQHLLINLDILRRP